MVPDRSITNTARLRDALEADHVGVHDAVTGDRVLVEIAQQREVQRLLLPNSLSVNGVSMLMPNTTAFALFSVARLSRKWQISLVHTLVNAAGKNASTTFLPAALAERHGLAVLIRAG